MTIFVSANEKCFGNVCVPISYDKTVLPLQNETNNVKVDFKGIRILKVDDEDFTITLSFLFYMNWIDTQLNVQSHSEDLVYRNKTFTYLNSAVMDEIWLPDPYIFNLQNIQSKPDTNFLMDQKYITKLMDVKSITIYCSMVFDHYPLDSHVCYLKVCSTSYLEDKVSYKTEPFMDDHDIDLSGEHFKQLTVLDYEVELNKLPEKHSFIELGRQTDILRRSIAGFEIKLHRKYKKYIIYYYMPSGLIAIISCVSFIIRLENPGRIGILVTMMLAMVNIFMSVTTNSPTSSSNTISSIAAWLIFCLIFVTLCLAEYGIILYLKYFWFKLSDEEFKFISRKVDLFSLYISLSIFPVSILIFWLMQCKSTV